MRLAGRPLSVSFRLILCIVSVGFYVIFLGFPTNARQGTPPNRSAASSGWDREGAAEYLDERMDIWFAQAKKLRTDQAETSCVSCHTTIPYVLARPALRRAMQVGPTTPQEMRLIEETARRVENCDAHQPLYDHNERKKTESRGTEAV